MQINGKLSHNFQINEGVLRGKLFIPLLLLTFIADLEMFMRENGCMGTNIDSYVDILLLLYADDLVITALSDVDL